MEFSRGVCSCISVAQSFIVYEQLRKPCSLRSWSGFSPGVFSCPSPGTCPREGLCNPSPNRSLARCSHWPRAEISTPELCIRAKSKKSPPRKKQATGKAQVSGFYQKNLHFKRFLWISLCFSFMLQKMCLMSLLTCFQQSTIFACPVGNREASKYRKSKDKDISGGVHICVLHREIVYVMFGITRICRLPLRSWDTLGCKHRTQERTRAAALVLLGC